MMGEIFQKVIQYIGFFQEKLKGVRVSRPSPSVLENLKVDDQGVKNNLSRYASVDVVEQDLLITVWDSLFIKKIETSLKSSNLGITYRVAGNNIRVFFPPMTYEQRFKFAKTVDQYCEEIKIKIRDERRDIIKIATENEKTKEGQKKIKNELEKKIKKYFEEIDQIVKKKKADIMKM